LKSVEAVNADQKQLPFQQLMNHFDGDLKGKTIALWGLAFKPNTDDMREAPSRVTIEGLLERGARVLAHDPEASDEARRIFGDRIDIRDSNYECLDGASALLIHTEWLPYRRPDFDAIRERLAQPVIFDGRNLYAPEQMARRGFEYHSIGRLPVGTGAAENAS
jgi:UDPglucose 6-dehydrogenase